MFLIFWPFSDYCSISFCFHSATPYIPIDRPLPFPFLTWGAGSSPSLLSLQVFLVAYRAHAVGAGVTVETASHGAKHWHLGLVGLLSHAVTEGQGGWERISLGGNRKMDPWLWLSAVCLFYFRVAWFQFDRSWWKAFLMWDYSCRHRGTAPGAFRQEFVELSQKQPESCCFFFFRSYENRTSKKTARTQSAPFQQSRSNDLPLVHGKHCLKQHWHKFYCRLYDTYIHKAPRNLK